MILQSFKFFQAWLATIALAGSGVGIGIVFVALITAIAPNFCRIINVSTIFLLRSILYFVRRIQKTKTLTLLTIFLWYRFDPYSNIESIDSPYAPYGVYSRRRPFWRNYHIFKEFPADLPEERLYYIWPNYPGVDKQPTLAEWLRDGWKWLHGNGWKSIEIDKTPITAEEIKWVKTLPAKFQDVSDDVIDRCVVISTKMQLEQASGPGPQKFDEKRAILKTIEETTAKNQMEMDTIINQYLEWYNYFTSPFITFYNNCVEFLQTWSVFQWVTSLISLVLLYYVARHFYNKWLSAEGGWISKRQLVGLISFDLVSNLLLGLYYLHMRETVMGVIMLRCPIAVSPVIFVVELLCFYIFHKYIRQSKIFLKLVEHKKRFVEWLWGLFTKFRVFFKKSWANVVKNGRLFFTRTKSLMKEWYTKFKIYIKGLVVKFKSDFESAKKREYDYIRSSIRRSYELNMDAVKNEYRILKRWWKRWKERYGGTGVK